MGDAVERGLRAADASVRLRAALEAGARPDTVQVEVLLERCRTEPDFFVRDMLTWALIRHPADVAVPRLVDELGSDVPQARSQALHTLSKFGDRRGWPAVAALIHDPDDDIARPAWRAAVVLVPASEAAGLATELARELGRGGEDLRRSLNRAFAVLGEAARPALDAVAASGSGLARTHAAAALRLIDDPDSDLGWSAAGARRADLLEKAPKPPAEPESSEGPAA